MAFETPGRLTKKVRLSLRKKWDRMAQITTDNAPIGVTRMASVNALRGFQSRLKRDMTLRLTMPQS